MERARSPSPRGVSTASFSSAVQSPDSQKNETGEKISPRITTKLVTLERRPATPSAQDASWKSSFCTDMGVARKVRQFYLCELLKTFVVFAGWSTKVGHAPYKTC